MNIRAILISIAAVAVMALSSCKTSKPVGATAYTANDNSKGDGEHTPAPAPEYPPIDLTGLDKATAALLAEADSWRGTPYLFGGNTREGVDCSGLVTQVFDRSLGIKLPRTSASQAEWCSPVEAAEMVPGDLVFFNTTKAHDGVSHVGIYIGNGCMIHSSSRRGVIESSLLTPYWTEHYLSSGRVEPFYALAAAKPETVTPKAEEMATVEAVETTETSESIESIELTDAAETAVEEAPAAALEPEPVAEPAGAPTPIRAARPSASPAQAISPDDARARVLSNLPDKPITPIKP